MAVNPYQVGSEQLPPLISNPTTSVNGMPYYPPNTSGGLSGQYTSAFPNQPVAPTFDALPTSDAGAQAQALDAGNPLDMSGLNAFQNQADSAGPTGWAQAAGANQNFLAMNAQQAGAGTVAGQGAAQRAQLASRGGLSSGAAERAAQGGANNYLSMNQNINQSNAANQMQIGMNDQQNKLSMMSQIPGMQLAAANFKQGQINTQLGANQTDIANAQAAAGAQNQFGLTSYNTAMAGYGAGQTAQATANQSCWLVTGLADHGVKLDAMLPFQLQKLKAYMAKEYRRETVFYIKHCGELVRRMNEAKFPWGDFAWFKDAILALMNTGAVHAAALLFMGEVTRLLDAYWPKCKHEAYRKLKAARLKRYAFAITVRPDASGMLSAPCLTNLPETAFATPSV